MNKSSYTATLCESCRNRNFDPASRMLAPWNRFVRYGICVALSTFMGCATVTQGTTEKVDVNTLVDGKPLSGAVCTLQQGSRQWTVTTPGEIEIPRSKAHVHITCVKEGYRMPAEADISAQSSALKSAGFGALGGGAVGAVTTGVAGAPLLLIPGVGWVLWPMMVGGGAVVGGAVSAGTDVASGAAYSYPSAIGITMLPIAPVSMSSHIQPTPAVTDAPVSQGK